VDLPDLPTPDDVRRAEQRLRGVAHRTPVVRSHALDEMAGARVFFKLEPFQRTGSFKFRGAYNHLASAPAGTLASGVLTTSSGNHAQAVALAARLLDSRAVVCMPDDAPAGKRAATEGYGAEVIGFDRYTEDRDELTARVAAERGLPVLHAYDDPAVIAGQGTVALELLEDAGPLDVIVVPVGGGGLISGCALAAHAAQEDVRVVGVEPQERPAARRALEEGAPTKVEVVETVADGQQTASIGRRNHALIAEHVEQVIGIDDASIVDAMRVLFERMKVAVEPSGATAAAAVLGGALQDLGGVSVGVVLSGGNVDAARFAALTAP
jgi:threonine dehydratase